MGKHTSPEGKLNTRKGTTQGGRPYEGMTWTGKDGRKVSRVEVGKGAGKTTGGYHSKVRDTAFNGATGPVTKQRVTKPGTVTPIKKSFTKPKVKK